MIVANHNIGRRQLLATALAGLCARSAAAQSDFPSRPIRLIVPYPPGGPTDVMARLVSQFLSGSLGQQVFVDNRPGAGSTLGGKLAATADPDGSTLLLGTPATLAIGPALYKSIEYDPNSFVPVAMLATFPFVMIAGPKAPVKNIADVLVYAKANPGKLSLGIPNGAPPHMLAAWFKTLTATDILIVPYKGAAGGVTDLIGGQIDLGIEPLSVVRAHLGDGSVRALATTTAARLPEIPDVPTMIESGVAGFVASSWTGILAPPGTPRPVVDKLNSAVNAILVSAEMQARLKSMGAEGKPGSPENFTAFIAADLPKWTAMAKLSGVSAE
jgi:tripartite-type tricarboxylate transporter receptor subunit TctC